MHSQSPYLLLNLNYFTQLTFPPHYWKPGPALSYVTTFSFSIPGAPTSHQGVRGKPVCRFHTFSMPSNHSETHACTWTGAGVSAGFTDVNTGHSLSCTFISHLARGYRVPSKSVVSALFHSDIELSLVIVYHPSATLTESIHSGFILNRYIHI